MPVFCGHTCDLASGVGIQAPMQLFTFVYPAFRSEISFRVFKAICPLCHPTRSWRNNQSLHEHIDTAKNFHSWKHFETCFDRLSILVPGGAKRGSTISRTTERSWLLLEDILIYLLFCIFEIECEVDGICGKLCLTHRSLWHRVPGCRKWSPATAASCRTHWGSGYQAVSLYHRLLHRGGILDSTKFFTCNSIDCDMMLWHGDLKKRLGDLDVSWFWYSWVLWCCWRIEWWRLMKIYSRSSWSY